MKQLIIIIILFSLLPELSGQMIWLKSAKMENESILQDIVNNQPIAVSKTDGLNQNFHHSFPLDQSVTIPLPYDLQEFHILSVFKSPKNSKENQIWSMGNKAEDFIVLSDHRLADFDDKKYFNFIHHNPQRAQINHLVKSSSQSKYNQLTISDNDISQAIPQLGADAQLFEIILLDQFISPISKAILETALAIQYNIRLAPGQHYESPNGRMWDTEKEHTFSHRVFGLLRSDQNNVNQLKSVQEWSAGSLQIELASTKEEKWQDQDYLLMGDNNNPLSFTSLNSTAEKLDRSWLIQSNTNESLYSINIIQQDWLEEIEDEERLYLVSSNTDQQIDLNSQFYQFDLYESQFKTQISSKKARSYWSIIKVKKNSFITSWDQPNCDSENGRIHIRSFNTDLPFTLRLSKNGRWLEEKQSKESQDWYSFDRLEPGEYLIEMITDTEIYTTEKIQLNPSNIPNPQLKAEYLFGETLEIPHEISWNQSIKYQWNYHGEYLHSKSSFVPKKTGEYALIVELDNCKATYSFVVENAPNNIEKMILLPNPSPDGRFNIIVEFKEPAPYSITIYTEDGRHIKSKDFPTAKYVEYLDYLPYDGKFIIQLSSLLSQESLTLIIQSN